MVALQFDLLPRTLRCGALRCDMDASHVVPHVCGSDPLSLCASQATPHSAPIPHRHRFYAVLPHQPRPVSERPAPALAAMPRLSFIEVMMTRVSTGEVLCRRDYPPRDCQLHLGFGFVVEVQEDEEATTSLQLFAGTNSWGTHTIILSYCTREGLASAEASVQQGRSHTQRQAHAHGRDAALRLLCSAVSMSARTGPPFLDSRAPCCAVLVCCAGDYRIWCRVVV